MAIGKKPRLLAGGALAVSLVAAACVQATGQGIRLRAHTATEAQPIVVVPADRSAGQNEVDIQIVGDIRTIRSNGIPSHTVGAFPNNGNPHAIQPQNQVVSMPVAPNAAASISDHEIGWDFGIAVNGVLIDPLAAEFWQGDRNSGWNYDAMGGAVPLGLDSNFAHVQPGGKYHYHSLPIGLMQELGWSSSVHSPLIGWAADGFPIYAVMGSLDGEVQPMTSSYRLRSGSRPGGDQPDGVFDGAFMQDYEYVAGSGDLDECNGAFTVSEDYPDGTYAYFLSNDFPQIPLCFVGAPDPSFRNRPAR